MSQELAQEIKKLRKSMKLSQEQLAHKIGVTVSTVNRWEAAKVAPHRVFVRTIEKLYRRFLGDKSEGDLG